ncbi:hypothetical protein Dsin_023004 [Dipteronia sinensis]|uniref:Reverse transcriptase domain-containing protein n=1 Tax=Dipteronia sinensis TaxID=43782 RepID=A0AAE0A3K4_9ROSI|nr:hypothetical protein Dsin_023004 [Dipteronia sinensis]
MHVYGWPILEQVASAGWNGRNQSHDRQRRSLMDGFNSDYKDKRLNQHRTFRDVLGGDSGKPAQQVESLNEKPLTMVLSYDRIEGEWLNICAVGVLKSFSSVSTVTAKLIRYFCSNFHQRSSGEGSFLVKLKEDNGPDNWLWVESHLGSKKYAWPGLLNLMSDKEGFMAQEDGVGETSFFDVIAVKRVRSKKQNDGDRQRRSISRNDSRDKEEVDDNHRPINLKSDNQSPTLGLVKGRKEKGNDIWVYVPKSRLALHQMLGGKLVLDKPQRQHRRLESNSYESSSSSEEAFKWAGECSLKADKENGRSINKWVSTSKLISQGERCWTGPKDPGYGSSLDSHMLAHLQELEAAFVRANSVMGLERQTWELVQPTTDIQSVSIERLSGDLNELLEAGEIAEPDYQHGKTHTDIEEDVDDRSHFTRPKTRKNKKSCHSSKKHGMVTTNSKSRGGASVELSEEEEPGTPEWLDIVVTDQRKDSDRKRQFFWNLEVKVAKVIEKGVSLGATLGFDFHGKENEIVEVLQSREKEDDDSLKEIRTLSGFKLKEGDKHTKRFHNHRKRSNHIGDISFEGKNLKDPLQVKAGVCNFFKSHFQNVTWTRPSIVGLNLKRFSDDEREVLEEDFSTEEVRSALCNCNGNKAPGPDGLNLHFIKSNWEVIREDFMEFLKEFHRDRSIVKDLNMPFIALISKVGKPETIRDFRLISLIGSMYKILAKVLANRLKKVMNSVIGEFQMSFVSSRQILDSYVVADEIINKWKGDKMGSSIETELW